jgi:predicted Zn-dependent peptidase
MSRFLLGANAARGVRVLLACLSLTCLLGASTPAPAAQGAGGGSAVTASSLAVPMSGTSAAQFSDGLTLVARKATASPTAAIEIWIKCPSNGYGAARPGLARLTALAIVEEKSGGPSLREEARRSGAQVAISVYNESTEIAMLAPAYLSPELLDKLLSRALHPHLDQAAFEAARQRLAAQQVASMDMADQVLRDTLFARLFISGPMHDSSFGDPKTLTGLTLDDISSFAARAYVPAQEIIVTVGDVDESDVAKRIAAAAPPAGATQTMPESKIAPYNDTPLSLTRESINAGGVALGWVGPPIADERAATAMDFLSDYLAHPTEGVVSKVVSGADATTAFTGQFVTLRNPGVFYVTASGEKLDPLITSALIRDAVNTALRQQLSKEDFERARASFVTHLLRDMQTSQGIADNYGWYFAQGALTYSPSATDTALSGDYFQQVASLSPDYVFSIARRYLTAKPAVIILPRGAVHISGMQ